MSSAALPPVPLLGFEPVLGTIDIIKTLRSGGSLSRTRTGGRAANIRDTAEPCHEEKLD
jgi:hypothetical protein